ncbi:hypothetical protein T440DRAFT_486168 [Plenodomus tracheiphilus IPT5]|uniref:DUF1640-domain-containing protein n=1 Tax=Plenodomus tracheiphilus IPT5 TaxID=1408161 RepID=A0A6A7BIA4_9PLEO|nr:hypothetical protein T440DRAFT_486168 [Plenodomus tracheiphilus IPT5]
MATPRLPFLWPMLFKPVGPPKLRTSSSQARSLSRRNRSQKGCRQFTTDPRRAQEVPTQRYGKAFEHKSKQEDKESLQILEDQKGTGPTEKPPPEPTHNDAEEEDEEPPAPTTTSPTTHPKTAPLPEASSTAPAEPAQTTEPKALDSVLHIPTAQQEEETKPPHLKTPPYVHHFDTYGLVRKLSQSQYTPEQSITIMKAVRQTLLTNMALAREGLVSKSNVENETYLFRAACSELKTEIGNRRRGEIERMRSDRNQLQHELDILGQRLGQETSGLREELKGLFDDRKMAVRQEQRSMETKIQELNYKITVALNSDARSEVEGLRWVLTRRAAITVGVSAFMLFVALRYTSYVQHQQQEQRRNKPPPPPSPMEVFAEPTRQPLVDPQSPTGQQEALGGELLATEGVSLG